MNIIKVKNDRIEVEIIRLQTKEAFMASDDVDYEDDELPFVPNNQ